MINFEELGDIVTALFFPILIIGIIITFTIFVVTANNENSKINLQDCIDVCHSNNYSFLKIKKHNNHNSICYCQDMNGRQVLYMV